MGLFAMFNSVPEVWAIEFRSNSEAHRYYNYMIHSFDTNLGNITINKDTWYIGTKLKKRFEGLFYGFMYEQGISSSEYTVKRIQIRGNFPD